MKKSEAAYIDVWTTPVQVPGKLGMHILGQQLTIVGMAFQVEVCRQECRD